MAEETISHVYEAWRSLNLPLWQQDLDVKSHEILKTQQSSLDSRKKLAETTKGRK